MRKGTQILFQSNARVAGSGYGGVYQNFTIALLKAGVDLVGPDGDEKADLHLFLGQPDRKTINAWRQKAGIFGIFTMFESETLPGNWVEDINEAFDFVVVPSIWCKTLFEGGGVSKPIFVVPLGIEPSRWPYLHRPKRDTFTIIWQGFHEQDRKGFSLLLDAFNDLGLPDSRLIKKISPYSLASPISFEFKAPVWSICKNMNPAELLMLLRTADLSVNPTAGEGFGLIPLEHMATGLPVIVSENSGCLEYVNPSYNLGVECKEGKSWFGEAYGTMMVPVYEDLKTKILYAYEHPQEMLEMGARASGWVHREWTYEKATVKLLEVLDGVARR